MKEKKEKKFKLKAPNPVIILVVIILLSAIATYVVPAGVFERVEDAVTGRMVVDPTTFHYVTQNPVKPFDIFMSLTLGLQKSGDVIFFLLIIGGAFGVMDATGAIKTGMGNMVRKMSGKEILLIPVCMTVFGLGSCFAANFEEFLAFVPLVIAVCLAMGFDSITAIGMVYGAAGAGYAGGCTNPFTVGVAQGIAGLPMFSGFGLRMAAFIALLAVSIAYVTWYGMRVRKNPERSDMYGVDMGEQISIDVNDIPTLTTRHKLVLLTFVGGIVALIVGVIKFGFYIDELAAIFLIVAILSGIFGGLRPGKIADEFIKGCGNLLYACLMIGLCSAATLILQNASILDTIINFLAGLLRGLPASLSACGMFIVQDIINVLIPSGSGQAAVTMPIMAPLADLIGVTRQTAVLAFQFGDSFTNIVAPTCGTIMAALAMGKISFGKWIKFMAPMFFMWWAVAFVFLIYAATVGYGPF
ncbi:AbgT family transporter [[Clostridium] symbiosum]|uniref:YfcC family protein n=1 Tax=Clostridium symbiosum TaxID=1512 RepID=UPI001D089547|nr:AbgT family transporter [[Clostridium] symbiosum]MCB6608552.1 AbgT family transporter [[Clostridium] symbiosum]MCB6932136.1 AbgT family transporter [[Clostridium] symbiosum]